MAHQSPAQLSTSLQKYKTPPKGHLPGQDFWRPNSPPQEKFLTLTCYEALYGGSAGGGKANLLSLEIPTPTGWRALGDLYRGATVFDANGNPTKVTWLSPINYTPEAWELEFDDGTKIECCVDHKWVTLTADERKAQLRLTPEWREQRKTKREKEHARRAAVRSATPGKRGAQGKSKRPDLAAMNAARVYEYKLPPSERGAVRTTREIVETLRVGKSQRANHCIVNPAPLQLPVAELTVDPYVLGAWLGDGDSRSGGLAGLDPEVWENAEAAGYVVTHSSTNPVSHYVRGLVGKLTSLGVTKPGDSPKGTPSNKHIPQQYLRASIEQRVALLQGLCDTDGYADPRKGSVEFTTTSERLKDGMMELLATLGIKPSCREGRAMLEGRDISAKWRIQFWTHFPCFRIKRKLERQKLSGFRGPHDRRYIVNARRVDPKPMRCIAVESASHTYLAGRQMVVTHNSDALLVDAIRYVGRGYGRKYAALLMRRNFPDLEMSLMRRAWELYPAVGGKFNSTNKTWTFPEGETVRFGHCQHENDVYQYLGAEFQYIGFDELTSFSENQYRYLISRLRSSVGVPVRLRGGTNPGGDGHDWVFRRFSPWLDPEFPFRAAPGQVVYFTPPPLDDPNGSERIVDRGERGAFGRTFIGASAKDNPVFADGEYEARLDQLDPLTRSRLKDGNWLTRAAAGVFFKARWFKFVNSAEELLPVIEKNPKRPHDAPPKQTITRIRYWDRAGTEPHEGNRDPDWTVGIKMALLPDKRIVVEDIQRFRASSGDVETRIRAIALADGKSVRIGIEQDPGQAGKFEASYYIRALSGWIVKAYPVTKAKEVRAGPISSQTEAGNVYLVKAKWNDHFARELEEFPDAKHDDQVDAFSGAFAALTENPPAPYGAQMRPILL